MSSESKKRKTNKKNHWGRDGKWLKFTGKLKTVSFYNSSSRQKFKKGNEDEQLD